MTKLIELTLELFVQRVSCPGVWLCQDGRVSLVIYALDSKYQSHLLFPVFPLDFQQIFYFRKRFHETCNLNNMRCLMKEETIYCELVQWCEDCESGGVTVLAQYLGNLNDILFPPLMCASSGVDLLMRRTKQFPGILSPKIEINTKVRIDEVWGENSFARASALPFPAKVCSCVRDKESMRQRQVCHTPMYHRVKCPKKASPLRLWSPSRSQLPSKCSLPNDSLAGSCQYFNRPGTQSREICFPPRRVPSCHYHITYKCSDCQRVGDAKKTKRHSVDSRYIDLEHSSTVRMAGKNLPKHLKGTPCICEICKRYHELFHYENNDD